MKVFRFMSKEEFDKFTNGEHLKNNKKHYEYTDGVKGKTTSEGFCFLAEKDFSPEEAFHFLNGVACMDVCCMFETDKKLNKTKGIYADHSQDKNPEDYSMCDVLELLKDIILNEGGNQPKMTIDEYCIKEYSNEDFELLRYAKPTFFGEWEWVKYEKN